MADKSSPPPPAPDQHGELVVVRNQWDQILSSDRDGSDSPQGLPTDPRLEEIDKTDRNEDDLCILLDADEVLFVDKLFDLLSRGTDFEIPRRMELVRPALETLLASVGPLFFSLKQIPEGFAHLKIKETIRNKIAVFLLQNAMAFRIIILVSRYEEAVTTALIGTQVERDGASLYGKSLGELAAMWKAENIAHKKGEKLSDELEGALTSAVADELKKRAASDANLKGKEFGTTAKTIGREVVRLVLCTSCAVGIEKYHVSCAIQDIAKGANLDCSVREIPITRGEYVKWNDERSGAAGSRHRGDAFTRPDPCEDEIRDDVVGFRLFFRK